MAENTDIEHARAAHQTVNASRVPFLRHWLSTSGLYSVLISLVLLALAKVDINAGGIVLFTLSFSILIYAELLFIRTTLSEVFAEAVSNSALLTVLLKGKLINVLFALIIAVYLAINLMIYLHTTGLFEYVLFALAGVTFMFVNRATGQVSAATLREKPAKAYGRIGVIFTIVVFIVVIDGLYQTFVPIDDRMTASFDKDIPLLVIEQSTHSFEYFQHLTRSILFVKYNLQSIELHDEIGPWFIWVKFFLLISPSPFVAYTLLLLSLFSVKRVKILVKR